MSIEPAGLAAPLPRRLTVPIQSGRLLLDIRREDLPLDQCLSYATRQNPRRLYLFVSKVLGKHWPVKPSAMRDTHRRLAAKIADLPGPLLVIGLAETATALGRGVAEDAALLAGRVHLYKHDKQTNNDREEGNTFDERC